MTDKDIQQVNSILYSLLRLEKFNAINACCKLVLHEAEYTTDQVVKAALFETFQKLEKLHDVE